MGRKPEFVIGLIGGIVGALAPLYTFVLLLIIYGLGLGALSDSPLPNPLIDILKLLVVSVPATLGIIGAFKVKKKVKTGGILMLLGAVGEALVFAYGYGFVFQSFGILTILSIIFLLIAGLLTFIRKD